MNKFSYTSISKKLCGLLLLLVVSNNYAGTIYQAGTVISFAQSVKGSMSLQQLLKHGNYGLGVENAMQGEGIIYNGKAYVSDIHGRTTVVSPNTKVSWIVVIDFKPTQHFVLHNIHSMQQLQTAITQHLSSANLF